MTLFSKKDLNLIESQVIKENVVKKEIKKLIEKEFLDIQKDFLLSFDKHPVTMEIEAGVNSTNISGTLNGIGNLFTYIGFSSGSKPIRPLRQILQKYEIQYHTQKTSVKINIILPTKEEVFAVAPMPWAKGRSWAKGIEKGISGLGNYLVKHQEIEASKSGKAIQTGYQVRSGKFRNTTYISKLLNDYYKEIKKLEKKVFT